MAEPLDNRLICEILKDVQVRLARLEGVRDEVHEGFASLRAHIAPQRADAAFFECRLVEPERDMDRVKRRLELSDPSENA
jgi:hypothetical protein